MILTLVAPCPIVAIVYIVVLTLPAHCHSPSVLSAVHAEDHLIFEDHVALGLCLIMILTYLFEGHFSWTAQYVRDTLWM